MSIVQSAYTNFLDELVAGQVADTQTCDIDSAFNRGSDVIPFGYAVRPATGASAEDGDIELGAGRPQVALLDAAMNNSATALSYDNARAGGFRIGQYILVNSEIMYVSLVGSDLTVNRAELGSTAAAHLNNAPVYAFDEALFRGVAIMDERLPASNGVTFTTGDIVPVLHRGDVAVPVSAAVSADGLVVATIVAVTSDPEGSFSSRTPDSTHVVVPGARFLTSAAASGVAVARFGTA